MTGRSLTPLGAYTDILTAYEIERAKSCMAIDLATSRLYDIAYAYESGTYRLGVPRSRRVGRRHRAFHDPHDRVMARYLDEYHVKPLADARARAIRAGKRTTSLRTALDRAGHVQTLVRVDVGGCFSSADLVRICERTGLRHALPGAAWKVLMQFPQVWQKALLAGAAENICLSHSLVELALQEIDAVALALGVPQKTHSKEAYPADPPQDLPRTPLGRGGALPATAARIAARPPLRPYGVTLYHRHKDDILVGLVGGRADAHALLTEMETAAETFGWSFSADKTVIVPADVGVQYLGLDVRFT